MDGPGAIDFFAAVTSRARSAAASDSPVRGDPVVGMSAVPAPAGTVLPGRGDPGSGLGRWESSHSVVSEGRHATYAHGSHQLGDCLRGRPATALVMGCRA